MVKMSIETSLTRVVLAGAVSVALGLGLSACGSPQSSSIGEPVESGQMTPSFEVLDSAETASTEQLEQANLYPCPTSIKGTKPVAGGLPNVVLPCLGEGPEVDLAGVRGKPMVVNVWASWCGPCRAELPILGAVSERTRDQVEFLGVNVSDTRKAGLEMAGTYKMRFPSVFDPQFASRAGLRVGGVPLTLFVRADGSVAYRHNGPVTSEDQLEQLIHTSLGVEV